MTKIKELREVITTDVWRLPCNDALMQGTLPLLLEAACLLGDIGPHLDRCVLPNDAPALYGWAEQVRTILEKLKGECNAAT